MSSGDNSVAIEKNCWVQCKESKWNPKNWDVSPKVIAQAAAITLFVCASLALFSALMINYPQVSGAFFTLFGLVGAAAIIVLIIGIVKMCKQYNPEDNRFDLCMTEFNDGNELKTTVLNKVDSRPLTEIALDRAKDALK